MNKQIINLFRLQCFLSLLIFFTVSTSFAENLKLGVVYSLMEKESGSSFVIDHTKVEEDIDLIIDKITNNCPASSNIKLVIQSEVVWKFTQPFENKYDFNYLKTFAEILQRKNIKWTPLLGVADVPHWLENSEKYKEDLSVGAYHGMPFSPFSDVWKISTKNWIIEFADQFQEYIGKGNLIEEILITNEMMFVSIYDALKTVDGNTIRADRLTITKWNELQSNNSILFKGYTQTQIPDEIQNEYLEFRNNKFEELLCNLRKWTVEALPDNKTIPVSWKFADIAQKIDTDKNKPLIDNYELRSKLCGLTKNILKKLLKDTPFIGIDIYEGRKEKCSDLTDNILFYKGYLNYSGDIYLTEYNALESLFTRDELKNCITECYNKCIKYITFFRWSDNGEANVNYGIDNKENQIEALSSIFSNIRNNDFLPDDIFPDVKNCSSSYSLAIGKLKEMNVISGHDDGYFRPDDPVNRAEFSKMLVKTIEFVNPTFFTTNMVKDYKQINIPYYRNIFKDLENDKVAWYDEFIYKLCLKKLDTSEARIINGYEDETFKPANTIIMAEMFKMIVQTFFPIDPTYNLKNEKWYDPFVRFIKESNDVHITPIYRNNKWISVDNYSIDELKKEVTRKEASKALFDAYMCYQTLENN